MSDSERAGPGPQDTPRTNAVIAGMQAGGDGDRKDLATLCRELERELAACTPTKSDSARTLTSLLRSARAEIRPIPGETLALCRCIDETIGPPACDCASPNGTLHDVGCSAYYPPSILDVNERKDASKGISGRASIGDES